MKGLSRLSVSGFIALSVTPAFSASSPGQASDEAIAFFEKKIRPILVEHCYSCHSADTKPSGDLRVDDLNGLLIGGNGGPAVVPGDPEKSLLIQRIHHENPKRRMPKEGELLTKEQEADLVQWIKDGAAWPRERIPSSIGKIRPKYTDLKQTHWALQPLKKSAVPEVRDQAWPASDVDRFILATLEAKNLAPVADADPATLIRRVTFDLTGLPPTPESIEHFTQNPSREAYEKLVDGLLASPRFAEQWGRHWLDVARYGESTGPSRNIPYPHASKYRDYVIDAIGRDVPFDRFVQEQIAGDLLPSGSRAERDRLLTATGFLALGVKDVNQRFKTRFLMDNVDEKIDTVTRSVLGLTVSCARCHDHKFDPVPTTDYYALAGIFTSTEDCAGVRNKMGGGGLDYYDPKHLITLGGDLPPVPPEQIEKLQAEVNKAKEAWDEIRGTPEGLKPGPDGRPTQRSYRQKYDKLQGELLALTDPASRGHAVHGVRDQQKPADTEVRIRGEAERLGPTIPRGFLTAFEVPGAEKVNPEQSGRLELARWLTHPKNPLSSRVIVNRAWQHLFGTGIVSTVDNFGVNGDAPSHPELLDHLANGFINDGWSLKRLVKSLVLTRAYQLGTDAPAAQREADPANRLVWRHSPRRLTAEEIRDTVLAASGSLQLQAPEHAASQKLKMIEMRDNGQEARGIHNAADTALHRSVYLPLLRGVTPKSLEAFDPVQQTLVTGQRETTTVPTQALFLLNSSFIRQQALALAERLLAKPDFSEPEAIKEIYLRALGRAPTEQELERAIRFVSESIAANQGADEAEAPTLIAAVSTPTDESTETKPAIPVNPDDVDRTDAVSVETKVSAKTPQSAAWLSLVQAVFGSAEFRFTR